MKIIEVTNKKTSKQFLDVGRIIYKDDSNWVCPLDKTINDTFDPKKNVFFTHGQASRWILFNDKNELIGRVAAFINNKKAYNFTQPTGGMGFFECTNGKEAAFLLFDTCRNWLIERGMEAMDGPINFGENDNFWGLLVEGFTPPSFGMQYHPPYYKAFFEEYGFSTFFVQVTNNLDLTKPFPERFLKIANWVRKKPGYSFKHFTFKDSEKFLKDLIEIYDDAWQFHENFTPMTMKDLQNSFAEAKPIMDEEFTWFAYHDNTPIAFLVMLPDANQILKLFKGKMNLINKLRFVWYKKQKTLTRTRITVMGVIPKFQKSGIESAIFWHMQKVMDKKPHYTDIELSWVGDFNPKMRALHESVGGVFSKRHITYRKLFNENAEFHSSKEIPMDTKNRK